MSANALMPLSQRLALVFAIAVSWLLGLVLRLYGGAVWDDIF